MNEAVNKVMLSMNGFRAQLNPLGKTLERSFDQAKQYAQERLGTAEDVTELPVEYLELEQKTDAIRTVVASLLRAYGNESMIPQSVTDTVGEMTRSIRSGVSSAIPALSESTGGAGSPTSSSPTTTAHALAGAFTTSAGVLGQEPVGAAVKKLAATQEKVGDAEVVLQKDMTAKFTKPASDLLNDHFANIARARRNVIQTRLLLDAVKTKFKAAAPPKLAAVQVELERAEDEFVDAVAEATKLMKGVIESPQVLRQIGELVSVQLAFHKQCAQALSELAPEIDEMQVTQEALYSSTKMA